MFDDIEGLNDFKPETIKADTGQGGGYNKGGYQGGNSTGYNNGGSGNNGGFNKFQKKPEVVTDIPYAPVAFFLDRDYPQEVKDCFYSFINKLISKNLIIRFITKLQELNYDKLEIYTAWKGFNGVESKFYYNNETSKLIAAKYNPGYEKLPDAVKALLARNARLLFGEKNNSCTLSLITWSPDGASRIMDITRETGRSSHVIRMALSNGISVLNVKRENAEVLFKKSFRLED